MSARLARTRRSLGAAAAGLFVSAVAASPAPAQAPPSTPADFAAAVAASNAYEIAAARVVLAGSRDAAVRAFAQDMVQAHTRMNAALVQAAAGDGSKPPAAIVGGEMAPLLAALQGARGPELDRAYARQQVVAHSGALVTEGRYAREGSDAALRRLATSDLPMIGQHLAAARSLRSRLGG